MGAAVNAGGRAGRAGWRRQAVLGDNARSLPARTCAMPGRLPLVAALISLAVAGCAPDAWKSRQATGFNLFVDQITQKCQPLSIGGRNLGAALSRGGLYDNDYNYFYDLTSRLYYGRTTRDAYRTGIIGFFGPGADTSRSVDCIVATLPAGVPAATAGPAVKLR
jgi:hypothetical protein